MKNEPGNKLRWETVMRLLESPRMTKINTIAAAIEFADLLLAELARTAKPEFEPTPISTLLELEARIRELETKNKALAELASVTLPEIERNNIATKERERIIMLLADRWGVRQSSIRLAVEPKP